MRTCSVGFPCGSGSKTTVFCSCSSAVSGEEVSGGHLDVSSGSAGGPLPGPAEVRPPAAPRRRQNFGVFLFRPAAQTPASEPGESDPRGDPPEPEARRSEEVRALRPAAGRSAGVCWRLGCSSAGISALLWFFRREVKLGRGRSLFRQETAARRVKNRDRTGH